MNFKKKVKKYFEKKGFIVIEVSSFPDLLIYGAVKDIAGNPVLMNLSFKEAGIEKIIPSFVVMDCKCKKKGEPTKQDYLEGIKRLSELKAGMFLIAYTKKNKILFKEIVLEPKNTMKNENAQRYIG